MIVSRTPLRMSFGGGGTDLPAFFNLEPGAVLSTAINKFIYVIVNRRFEPEIRVSYSRTEIVSGIDEIDHEIAREGLRLANLPSHIEVLTVADVPAGTGLGSSSAVTVGLLNALYAFQGRARTPEELAGGACEIEIDVLEHPIGKQDQYIAAYGGFHLFQFDPNGKVRVEPVVCAAGRLEQLHRNLMLFYTGITRPANTILERQSTNTSSTGLVRDYLRRMRDLAFEMRLVLGGDAPLDQFGMLLHEGWELKKRIAEGISSPDIEAWYERAIAAGALGGKLLGAGGGGCLLFYCPYGRQSQVRVALRDLTEIHFRFEDEGSKILFLGR